MIGLVVRPGFPRRTTPVVGRQWYSYAYDPDRYLEVEKYDRDDRKVRSWRVKILAPPAGSG
jgi:hypothetical protein